MTNQAYLKKLESLITAEPDAKGLTDFAVAFLEGAAEELQIYTMCATTADAPDNAMPLYGGTPENRMLLCYTSTAEAAKFSQPMPEDGSLKALCMPVSAHTVLDTALANAGVHAIGFNMDDDQSFVLPKPILETLVKQK